MLRMALFLCVISVLPAPLALSQSESGPPVPRILEAGFDAYRAGGPDEALRVWLRNSPLEGTGEIGKADQVLHAAQIQFGQWRSFDIISDHTISRSTRVIYMTLDFDKGPLFAKFVLYRTEPGYIVTSVAFSPNDTDVLPAQPL
ncbi:MAG TPA: hypothetical protein VME68_06315 [Acidobacteriaceae bacterium]|nr:hypothetical protein [Acidobacteriaceae bacterium]